MSKYWGKWTKKLLKFVKSGELIKVMRFDTKKEARQRRDDFAKSRGVIDRGGDLVDENGKKINISVFLRNKEVYLGRNLDKVGEKYGD